MKVLGITGWSGSGKTVLITRLIPTLIARGLSVSTIKHAHHAFDIDLPGKDSFEHRAAGANEVIISSGRRLAQIKELRGAPEPGLADLLRRLSPCDLVLVEGFKRDPHPKLEVLRSANNRPPLHPNNPSIVAVASDTPLLEMRSSWVHIDDIEAVTEIVLTRALPIADVLHRLERDGATER